MTMKTMSSMNLGSVIGSQPVECTNEIQVEVLKNNADHILEWANIPLRYQNAEFKAKTPQQETLINALRVNFNGKPLSEINDMLIYGTVGTGKTHLCISMLLKLAAANVYCRYTTEHNLLDLYFQKRFSDFDGFKKVNILVIDELGKRPLQDWQMIQLEELISYRYNNLLPTIFITNMEIKEFKEFVGDRVADRMRENKVVRVLMNGESLRGNL